MNDRLITLAGSLLSILLIAGLLMPKDNRNENASRPTSIDRGEQGLYGLAQWLSQNEIPTSSLRRRYQHLLTDPTLPETGNLIIVSEPAPTVPSRVEMAALRSWLSRGNSLLLLLAASDRPRWAENSGYFDHPLLDSLGYGFQRVEHDQQEASEAQRRPLKLSDIEAAMSADKRQRSNLQPAADPLLADIETVAGYRPRLSAFSDRQLHSDTARRIVLPLLYGGEPALPVFWELRNGDGRVWVSAYADLFGNVTLGEADNARLISALLASALDSGGRVIFDDMHFGISDLYDPDNFFRDTRLHVSLLFIAAFWTLYALGYNNRLAPPGHRRTRPSAAAFVQAMAGFLARKVGSAAIARGILDDFRRQVARRRHGAADERPIGTLLHNQCSAPAALLEELNRMEQDSRHAGSIDLRRLTRLIDTIKGAMR